ncbi:MAG TPA: MoxR family ATPase [Candidatus Akkermansia intestinigallinarum]|uniref:MoxR family ATPase n=1 Tax=Candidatus Akkermansia intestinigallinarum TaxID=2838431 RepID=A0A9D1VCF9_9BACT|nr:MoxR family ATPase [Candidatus Akkermansia intestinigallinarum]
MNTQDINEQIAEQSGWVAAVRSEMAKVVVGQHELINRLLLSLLCKGHVLLEGVPGLAKTLSVKALAGTMHAAFSRIQFTPDLLPADLLGTMVYNPEERAFTAKKGPVFANLILADEINRAPAKVQSALLEAMQERQVTLGETSYPLPNPFLVLATQNPIEQEGTYQLPEAQLDRFLFKVVVSYPAREDELQVLRMMSNTGAAPTTQPVLSVEELDASRRLMNQIYIDPAVEGYIVDLVRATREPERVDRDLDGMVRAGASPRATINIALASKALAFMNRRSYVKPQDIKDLAHDILRHRILLSYEAEAASVTSDMVIDRILSKVPVP